MTTTEIFDLIVSQPKWYSSIPVANEVGKFQTPQYGNTLRKRFVAGELSEKKIEEVFGYFGFIKTETQWKKK